MDLPAQRINEVLPEITAFRHELHAHPELSRKEYETSRRVRERLARLPHLKVLPPLGETDVVAILNPDRDGPCLALRADMDALPIQEEASHAALPYRSQVDGVMHACGHDGHTANLLGTAKVLSGMADQLPGRVVFIFQPDEEATGGAGVLCRQGLFDVTRIDAIVALHAWPQRAVGTISMRYGQVQAASTCFNVTVRGAGCHGAYPHRGIDPIVVAAHTITALQTIVGRSVDPVDAGVVTVGTIHAGTAQNVIPPECAMKGTLRYLRPEVGTLLRERVSEVVEHTARAHRATAVVSFEEGYPPLRNDDRIARFVERTGREVLGDACVACDDPPSMGVEDFAYYTERVPGMMFRLGVRAKDADACPPLHNPRFNFNDDALPIGMRMFCELAVRFLNNRLGA